MKDGEYHWNTQDCKIPLLKSTHFISDASFDNDEKMSSSFNHSFRYSYNDGNNSKNFEFDTALAFLKSVIKNNTSMKDFSDFNSGVYNGAGIMNAYLRVLDVYSELKISKKEYENPHLKFQRVKVLETDVLDELEREASTGIISNALDEELQDLVEHNLLVIPIFVSVTSLII